jgi:O-methyltransferase
MALVSTGLQADVAAYVEGGAHEPSPVLAKIREDIVRTGEEEIQVSQAQGMLLSVLVRSAGARRILEIGTYLGYSAIWLAEAAGAGAHIDTLEIDGGRAAAARRWIAKAALPCSVTLHEGSADQLLPGFPSGSYDLVFIDANKVGYPCYLDHAIRLTRPGGLIIADNALHKGRVVEPEPSRPTTRAIKEYNARAWADPALVSVLLPIGDGLFVSVRR